MKVHTIISILEALRSELTYETEHENKIGEILSCCISDFHKFVSANLPELSKDVKRMVKKGEYIEAIKKYREINGVGLKDSKSAVDSYKSKLKLHDDTTHTNVNQNGTVVPF